MSDKFKQEVADLLKANSYENGVGVSVVEADKALAICVMFVQREATAAQRSASGNVLLGVASQIYSGSHSPATAEYCGGHSLSFEDAVNDAGFLIAAVKAKVDGE